MGQQKTDTVLVLGSGPNVLAAQDWPKTWFDRIVVINNAWQVRPDWDDLVYPEDFPSDRMPPDTRTQQKLIDAAAFVPAQNSFGGFVYAGGTMAFTSAYWALHAHKPRVMAFLGCDMMYPSQGKTHFYGRGTADPLRNDITLRDLGAKSARLAAIANQQGCACVNLSSEPSALLFPRTNAAELRGLNVNIDLETGSYHRLRQREDDLGYVTPDGRYWEDSTLFDEKKLAALDLDWRDFYTSAVKNLSGLAGVGESR